MWETGPLWEVMLRGEMYGWIQLEEPCVGDRTPAGGHARRRDMCVVIQLEETSVGERTPTGGHAQRRDVCVLEVGTGPFPRSRRPHVRRASQHPYRVPLAHV